MSTYRAPVEDMQFVIDELCNIGEELASVESFAESGVGWLRFHWASEKPQLWLEAVASLAKLELPDAVAALLGNEQDQGAASYLAPRSEGYRDRSFTRKFLIDYQDRILFGRDQFDNVHQEFLRQLGLPQTVLRKIFADNALRLVPI